MKASFGKKIAVLCLSAAMAIGVGFGLSGIKTEKAATEYKDIVAESYKLNSIVKQVYKHLSDGVFVRSDHNPVIGDIHIHIYILIFNKLFKLYDCLTGKVVYIKYGIINRQIAVFYTGEAEQVCNQT